MTKLKKITIAHDLTEVFPASGYRKWKKGEITNPTWLKQNGTEGDYISLRNAKELEQFFAYISGQHPAQNVGYYNTFSTGLDKKGNRMVGLYDQDESMTQKKVAVIIVLDPALTNRILESVEEDCHE